MSPATQNMALEAALTFMVLLLAMSILAIFSTPPAPAGIPAGQAEDSPAGRHTAGYAPDSAMTAASPVSDAEMRRRRRYEGRHAAGFVAEPRQGPPWGPADRPPGPAS